MNESRRTEAGQAAVLLALVFLGMLAFAALAIDGGNAYFQRRNAQNAADGAVIAGAREMHRVMKGRPEEVPYYMTAEDWVRYSINDVAQRNGVPDPEVMSETVNSNVVAWFLNNEGVPITITLPTGVDRWMVGNGYGIPGNARGIASEVTIPFSSFLAGLIGRPRMAASAYASAIDRDRYWLGGFALWADGDCQYAAHTSCSTGRFDGGLHSNSGFSLGGGGGGGNYFTGTVEHACGENFNTSQWTEFFDPPEPENPSCTAPAPLPPLFEDGIAGFMPGGRYAVAAGGYYFDYSMATEAVPLDIGSIADLGLAGLYYAPYGFDLSGSNSGSNPITLTLVSSGPIEFAGSASFLRPFVPFDVDELASITPPFEEGQLLLYTTSDPAYSSGCGNPCACTAVKIVGSTLNWEGVIYAPNGMVNQSGSGNLALVGSIVAWGFDLTGSTIEITYDIDYDMPLPPAILLDQ